MRTTDVYMYINGENEAFIYMKITNASEARGLDRSVVRFPSPLLVITTDFHIRMWKPTIRFLGPWYNEQCI